MRRSRFGELLQVDGSYHAWFENRGDKCTLVIFVDDATSKLTACRFVPTETKEAYLKILEDHLSKYGRPLGLYVDKHSIFRTSRDNSEVKENETHFGRILRELEIELICAHSPQAKGRVERANGILQDRLIKEMRLRGISTIDEANKYLPIFMEEYNRKFGKEPCDAENAHRPLRHGEDLETVFAERITRKLSKSLSFRYEGAIYQMHPACPNRFGRTYVTILIKRGKPLIVESGGKEYPYTIYEVRCSPKTGQMNKVISSIL